MDKIEEIDHLGLGLAQKLKELVPLEEPDSVLSGEVVAITTIQGDFINFSYEFKIRRTDKSADVFFDDGSRVINSIIIRSVSLE